MVTNHSLVKSRSRRKFWIFGIGALVLILVGLAVWHFSHHSHDSTSNGNQAAYNNSKKEAVVNNGGQPVTDNGKGSTQSGNYKPPTTNNGITITPTQSNNTVVISTKLVGYSDGTCTLTATNGSKTTSQTAEVIFAANYSSCAGFAVPVSKLGSGTWNLTLSVLTDGVTTSKSATFVVSP